MMVFEKRGNPEYTKNNLSGQRRQPTTNSTHIWHRRRDLNPGHVGGKRVLSPLRLCKDFVALRCNHRRNTRARILGNSRPKQTQVNSSI